MATCATRWQDYYNTAKNPSGGSPKHNVKQETLPLAELN